VVYCVSFKNNMTDEGQDTTLNNDGVALNRSHLEMINIAQNSC